MDKMKWVTNLTRQMGVHTPIPASLMEAAEKAASISEVNRHVYEWIEALPKQHASIPADIAELLNGYQYESQEIKKLTEQVKQHRRNYDNYMANAHSYLTSMCTDNERLMRARDQAVLTPVDLLNQVTDPWWTFNADRTKIVSVANDQAILVFDTPDLVIRHQLETDSEPKEINLGKFTVEYHRSGMRFLARPLSGNTLIGGTPHPHIDSSGNICLGTGKDMVLNELLSMRLDKAMAIVRTIITSYGENPYVNFSQFWRELNPPAESEPFEWHTTNSYFIMDLRILEKEGKKLLKEHLSSSYQDGQIYKRTDDDGSMYQTVPVRGFQKYYPALNYSTAGIYVKLHRGEYLQLTNPRRW